MIKVIARKGVRVPVEGNPDRYITDDKPVDVPQTAYWLRRIKDGDLLRHTDSAAAPTEKADKPAGKSAAPAAKADK